MDIVAARGPTALFHPAAEHAELQRRGADVHRQDVPAHTRPSFSSTDRSASTCAAVRGASGLRGMPPLYPARVMAAFTPGGPRSEEHTSELQSLRHLVCRLLLE